jgi:hypothetical protein
MQVELNQRELKILREVVSYLDLDVLNDNLNRAGRMQDVTDEELEELGDKLYKASLT